MDIFGNEFDVQVIASGELYSGKIIVAQNGNFDTRLDAITNNEFGLHGHISGKISQDRSGGNHYTINCTFEQLTAFPDIPPLFSLNTIAESNTEEHSIIFKNAKDDLSIALAKSGINIFDEIEEDDEDYIEEDEENLEHQKAEGVRTEDEALATQPSTIDQSQVQVNQTSGQSITDENEVLKIQEQLSKVIPRS